jgi:hypothetical protein
MSVHFDFIVDDLDAENIMDIMNKEKCCCLEEATWAASQKEPKLVDALKNHAAYIDGLISKMLNTRVAEQRDIDIINRGINES